MPIGGMYIKHVHHDTTYFPFLPCLPQVEKPVPTRCCGVSILRLASFNMFTQKSASTNIFTTDVIADK